MGCLGLVYVVASIGAFRDCLITFPCGFFKITENALRYF